MTRSTPSTITSWPEPRRVLTVSDEADKARARRNVILALVHVAIVVAILVGFVVAQTQRAAGG